ncbi:MAG: MBL fold metallo-hydrolase [Thermoleophilia bacterium]
MTNIKTIRLRGVNCYLVKTGGGFILIDTGMSTARARLEKELQRTGCLPGSLTLVVLTHGDVDHAGNGAFLREKYGAKIAMHCEDSGMVEHGDDLWNRKARPDRISMLGRIIMPVGKIMAATGLAGKFETFKPDICLEDGQSLSEYAFDARVLHLPGHSKGSMGVLTANGDLICGDLLMNMRKPDAHFAIDDLKDFHASLVKLEKEEISIIYPGHGKPFPMASLSPE